LLFLFGTRNVDGQNNFLVSGGSISDDTFHHVAATWTGDTTADGVKLYVDGALVGTGTAAVPIGTDSIVLNVGGHSTISAHHKLAGLVDEIEVFNRVLTPAEIAAIFNAGSAGKCKEALDSLGPATLWIGLKNSDDQGTQFDLQAQVSINNTVVATATTRCITGVTRNPNLAKEVQVPFGALPPVGFASGDVFSLKLLTRIGTNPDNTKCAGPGGSHNNAVGLQLYYDGVSRPSRFTAEIPPDPLTAFFLHSTGTNFFLDETAPTAMSAKFKDSAAVNFAGGNPWKEIGTWSMTLP
jgi:hypothetical protein